MNLKQLTALVIIVGVGLFLYNEFTVNLIPGSQSTVTPFDDTSRNSWDEHFQEVSIPSTVDGHIQRAYFYDAHKQDSRPLLVSLHTWSGSYRQEDALAELCRSSDIHYIHPDFRGPNNDIDACCSSRALSDIDDAISWAIARAKVDTSRIYVIGVSGGGYATLASFMRLKHSVKRFSAWASITDLVAWYYEGRSLNNKYADDILQCTGSDSATLDVTAAKERSPLYWQSPVSGRLNSQLFIYAGVHDGVTGSVPITHSIRFFNKMLDAMGVRDSSKYVTVAEERRLLEARKPLGDFASIGGRKICLQKVHGNLKLVIFDGGHEMLTEYAFAELTK